MTKVRYQDEQGVFHTRLVPSKAECESGETLRAEGEATLESVHVLHAMAKYGGGFVKALAEAGFRADSTNLAKIKAAWPNEWQLYGILAQRDRAKKEGQ